MIIKEIYKKCGVKAVENLLKCRSTNRNIVWGTKNKKGRQISQEDIYLISPRWKKSTKEQQSRTQSKAEVFTPLKIIEQMVNEVDSEISNTDQKHIDYLKTIYLEITCGEGHFITTRYDPETGVVIPIEDRVGILDRKIRLINKNIDDINEWYQHIKIAYKSVYGYEYQGDSLFIARANLLLTLIDNAEYKLRTRLSHEYINRISEIISWNFWQMDGLSHTVPYSKMENSYQLNLIGEPIEYKEKYAKIKNWKDNCTVLFKDLIKS